MNKTEKLNDKIYFVKTMLAGDYLPLYQPIIKGKEFSAFLDGGTKSMLPQLLQAVEDAKINERDMRMVIQTHSHADHMGCNAAFKQRFGCIIAGHHQYAHWHSDLDRHFQEWARPYPELVPFSAEHRQGLADWVDAPHQIDVYVDEGSVIDLGGGMRLTAYNFPGHMKNDMGWFEPTTRTMIMGDGITATEWPHFHMHLTVPGYRRTLEKVPVVFRDLQVQTVFLTHFGPITLNDALVMVDKASAMLDKMDRTLIRVMASKETVSLEEIWTRVSAEMGKERDFQALNTIAAHVEDFITRGIIRQVRPMVYTLR